MPDFGKPNRTGRSSGKLSSREGRTQKPPPGEPWVWLTRELLTSDAWCSLRINSRRLIEFLLIEHMSHAGRCNSDLKVTYDQLQAFGLSRSEISAAIEEAEFLGLIRVNHGGRWQMTNQPSTFCLTFYSDKDGNPATNDWKRVDLDQIQRRRRAKKQKTMSKSRTTVVRKVELRTIDGGKPR